MFDRESLSLLSDAAAILESMFAQMPDVPGDVDIAPLRGVLMRTAERMQDNYPYPHPLYAGQMLKPPHPIARLAYTLALWVNPNNHALDGGKASSRMEKECIRELGTMFGWEGHLGHLCGGGTVANLEALWIADSLSSRRKVVAFEQAHYTHQRICGVLGIPFEPIPCAPDGRIDVRALERRLEAGDVGTVVATMGTTALGVVDPLRDILALRDRYGFRLHADAAYGGYFTLVDDLNTSTRADFDHLRHVDSIVVDPHKHGLQPYGCGCVLFREPSVAAFYKHDSPYTYFTSDELHLGEISLECSRPGASAVALWATQQMFPLVRGGEFARLLTKSRRAALALYARLKADARFVVMTEPQLDIVVWTLAGGSASEISTTVRRVFDACVEQHLYLALAEVPCSLFADATFVFDQPTITCLRSCLMKPEHLDWLDDIWERLVRAMSEVA